MADKDADVQRIKELIKIMNENDLTEIEIKHGDDQLSLRRTPPVQVASYPAPIMAPLPSGTPHSLPVEGQTAQGTPQAGRPGQENLLEVKSPIVGTFYQAPSPDSEPYVEIGAHVDSTSVVCIIEAMKVMNEIKAEVSGTVVERRVSNGQAVEYGQVLFRVRPD
jgi:acetyl-CoA carboxylase biotin carboxyl carrier protein